MIIVPACDLLVSCGGDIESEFQFALRNTARGNIEMTLDTIPRGITARVTSVEASHRHGLRLMEMGVVPGAEVRVVKSAPLGDPIQVCVRNYHLALRRAEAKSITVTFTKEWKPPNPYAYLIKIR